VSSLSIHNLWFTIKGKDILRGLDLSIPAGEIHALIGTNGTGKSTLAQLIMGCAGYAPTRGDIVFQDRTINKLSIHERARLGIAMVWQEPARFEGLRVAEYLTLGDKGADVSSLLHSVGLNPQDYADRMVDKTLSGGERKRIELASVLALQPTLAILDEPASGIDLVSVHDIIEVIYAFRAIEASVLLITHREEFAHIAEKASLLCGGQILFSGKPDRVVDRYKSRACIVCDSKGCRYDQVQ
jgi:Fe-S cluster assembly ATP-binding protein